MKPLRNTCRSSRRRSVTNGMSIDLLEISTAQELTDENRPAAARNRPLQERDMPARTLIDDLIAEQQSLTAVAKFSRKHEHGEVPAQAKYYRDLIPFSKPNEGEQYAFAVDLD